MIKYAQLKCTVFASSLSPKPLRKQRFPQKQMGVECNNPEESNLESTVVFAVINTRWNVLIFDE